MVFCTFKSFVETIERKELVVALMCLWIVQSYQLLSLLHSVQQGAQTNLMKLFFVTNWQFV